MKIALLHDSVLPPKTYGGIERVVVNLAYELKKLGHVVTVLTRNESVLPGLETMVLPPDFERRVIETWLPPGFDILHSHQPLKIKPSMPYLITIHGNGQKGETYWPNTSFVSRSHARNHGAKYFVYNGIDLAHYPFSSDKENYFVFLAKASWRVKNLKTAISLAKDLRTPLHVMGGSGVDSEFVRYHGLVGEAEKLPLLMRAKALIYATNWEEPFGIALTEAMACGTPVIASSNGAMPEIVTAEAGFVCRSYQDMLTAGGQVARLNSRACRDAVEQRFSVATMAVGYLDLYRRILADGELDQAPHYAFDSSRLAYVFKATLWNRLQFALLGKI